MDNDTTTFSPPQAADRLRSAGYPITPVSVRTWCATKGFGIRVMNRWRIPDANIRAIEQELAAARASSCPASKG